MRERVAHGLGPIHQTPVQECGSIARSSRLSAGFSTRASWLLAGVWLIIAGPALGQIANDDSYSVDEDAGLNVAAPGVLGNDVGVGLTAIQQSSGSNGSAALNGNGSFSYTPDANFFGVDTFTYIVIDAAEQESSPATVTVTVNPVNDPPTTMSDSYTVNEDTTLTRNAAQGVLANDSDIDGNALTASLVTNVGNGSLTLNPNGSFTYTPNANFVGDDTFTYRAVDGATPNGQNPPVTVTITVNPVNDPPVANPDSYTTPEDVPLSVAAPGVLTNDNDEEGNALTAQLVSQPAVGTGTVALSSNGSFTYTPPLNFFGSTSFTYRAVDNGSPPAQSTPPTTVTITVTGVNDPPVANDDSYMVDEDTPLSVNAANGVLANDADPDGNALTAVLDDDVSNGTLQLFANGRFTYTPTTGFSGIDTFTYHADDGTDPSNIATVTITVAEVNDAPIANPDNYSTDEDLALTVNAANGVLANDTDEEGGALTAQLATSTTNGTITLNPNGSFTYTPNPNYSGADTFTYRARDNGTPQAQSEPTTVTITVNPRNDAPVAAADSYTTAEDTTLNVGVGLGVLANDVDADSADVLTAVLVDDVANGTLTLAPNGSFAYTPAADFFGADSFTYLAADNSGAPPGPLQSDTVTVMIDVTPVNDPPRPIAVDPDPPVPDQTATENVAYLLDLRPFFTDPDGDDLLITYAFSNLPDGLTATMLGEISGMPALDTSIRECDTGEVGVTVSDGLDALLTTFCLRVLEAGRADLALSLAAAPAPALINQQVDWTFSVENLSVESVGNITIDAVFSGQVPFTLSNAPNCTTMPQGNQTLLSCTGGPIAGGASATIIVSGSSTQAGDVLTTATVSISDPIPLDLNLENNDASGALNVAQTLAAGAGQKLTVTEHRASAVGDLNGDGFEDLVVATGATQSTQVYANIVDPADPGGNKRAFSELPTSLGDQGPGGAVALADLDGNGALDIVTANRAGQANRIFMNMSTGDGSFDFALLPDALGAPEDVSNAAAIADVDGDGDLDIVFANSSPNPVFINDGSTFNQREALGNDESRAVVVVDLYGDPLPELVFANADDDATIYSYNSAGDFYDVAALATGPTTSVAVGDFDADGRADLVFGRGATALGVPSNPVFLNTTMNGAGQFFLAAELGASPTNAVLVIDTDDDTDLDIVAINATGGHQIFTNNGNGDFTLHAQQFASGSATAASFGKLSVDDRIDVAVSGRAGIDVFYNDGLGNLGPGDTGSPVIQLLGQAAIELIVEAEYTDAGATAMDTIDGDLTELIVVDNPVDTAVLGSYTVTYSVVDTSGNAATPVTRTVTVGARTGTGGGGGGAFSLGMALFLATLSLARALHHRRLRLSWSKR